MHVPGGQVLQGAAPLVLVLDPDGSGGGCRESRVAPAAGLDGGLLVGGDDVVVVPQRLSVELAGVQVEDHPGLGLEVGVSGKDPGAVGPRADGVVVEPAPDGRPRDGRHDPPGHHLGGDVGDEQSGQGQIKGPRQLTGDRLDRHHHEWGKKPPGVPGGAVPPAPLIVARRSASATPRRRPDAC